MNLMDNRYLTWLVCLIFSSGIGINSITGVVCVGDDGHVKYESLCQPCCSGSATDCTLDEKQGEPDHHGCCGNCTDLSFFQDPLLKRISIEHHLDDEIIIGVSVNLCCVPDLHSMRATRLLRVDKVPHHKDPDLLSTIILIC